MVSNKFFSDCPTLKILNFEMLVSSDILGVSFVTRLSQSKLDKITVSKNRFST